MDDSLSMLSSDAIRAPTLCHRSHLSVDQEDLEGANMGDESDLLSVSRHTAPVAESAEAWLTAEIGEAMDAECTDASMSQNMAGDLNVIAPAVMKIVLKGKPFHISVAPNDDVKKIASEFILTQKIKPEARALIEGELVKTQLDATLSHVKKLYKSNVILLREASAYKTMEQRALAAEKHSQRLSEALGRIKYTIPQVQTVVQDSVASAQEYSESAANLALQLSEAKSNYDKLVANHAAALASVAELTDQLCQKDNIISLHRFEATEKELEIESLKKEMEMTVAEKEVALAAAEVASAEKEQALRCVQKQGTVATARQPDVPRLSTMNQLNAELNASLQQVTELKNKVKLLESKAKHSKSILEVAEVSRNALQVNMQQIKHNLDKSNAELATTSRRLHDTERDLENLKESTALEQSHLLKENQVLKNELHKERTVSVHLKDCISDFSQRLLQALLDLSHSGSASALADLAQILNFPGDWSALRQPSSLIDTSDAPMDQENCDENTVAGSVDKKLSENAQAIADSSPPASPLVSGTKQPKAVPTPIRRLWNSISVHQDLSEKFVSSVVDDDVSEAKTVMSISLNSHECLGRGGIHRVGSVSFDFSSGGQELPRKASPPKSDLKQGKGKFNGLSPVVEDRLLRNIFTHYTSEAKGVLRASRFLRFAKEYNICVHEEKGGLEVIYGGHENLKLSTGDIDVIFAIALRKTDLANSNLQHSHSGSDALRKAWGANRKARVGGEANALSYPQFLEALYLCGERMYTAVIEKETGTVIDCLPSSQRAAASRSAFEVMLVKKIAPKADEQSIMPWPLMYLDQTVSLLHFDVRVSESLLRYARTLSLWFSRGAGGKLIDDVGWGEAGVFVGVTYKGLSSVCHSTQLVPQLVQEHELYRIFEEVLQWSVTDIRVFVENLPEEMRTLHHVSNELNARLLGKTASLKKILGFVGFVYVVATIATQAFPHTPIEHRLDYLFERTSAGSAHNISPMLGRRG